MYHSLTFVLILSCKFHSHFFPNLIKCHRQVAEFVFILASDLRNFILSCHQIDRAFSVSNSISDQNK